MRTEVTPKEVFWEMDWSRLNPDGTRVYPDKPEKEMMFEPDMALALLLINGVIFINDHWWEKEWPEKAKRTFSLSVNMNDVFVWGGADAEEFYFDELKEIYQHWLCDNGWGPVVYMIRKQSLMPQKPVYDMIQANSVWDLDSMGLDPNPCCPYWKEYFIKEQCKTIKGRISYWWSKWKS